MIFNRTLYKSRAAAGEALSEYLAAGVLSADDFPRVKTVGSNRYAIELWADVN